MTHQDQDSRAAHAVAELRLLAQALIAKLEPALRGMAQEQGSGPYPHTGCEWCPVCATVALLRGENHELLAFLAGHGAAAAALLRQYVEGPGGGPQAGGPQAGGPQAGGTAAGGGAGSGDSDAVAARFSEIVRQFSTFAGTLGASTAAGVDNDGRQQQPAGRRRFQPITVVVKP